MDKNRSVSCPGPSLGQISRTVQVVAEKADVAHETVTAQPDRSNALASVDLFSLGPTVQQQGYVLRLHRKQGGEGTSNQSFALTQTQSWSV